RPLSSSLFPYTTLFRSIISGAELPNGGRVTRQMAVSWPLAFGGAFQGSLTGLDNIRFICRVYGADFHAARPFVEDFSELGKYLRSEEHTSELQSLAYLV